MKKWKKVLLYVLTVLLVMAGVCGYFLFLYPHEQDFVESYYKVQSDKLTNHLRIVQLSDLHLREFGENNCDLVARIRALKPDIIAITGDMNDKKSDDTHVVTDLCAQLVEIAPVYYVPGNHEWPKIVFEGSTLASDLEALGVHFLADKYDVSVADSQERADSRCTASLEAALRRTANMYDTCVPLNQDIRLKRGKVHYALLPVWMLHTKWNGKDFLFAMNGQTGRLVGDLPTDMGKFWTTFAAIAIPVTALATLILHIL